MCGQVGREEAIRLTELIREEVVVVRLSYKCAMNSISFLLLLCLAGSTLAGFLSAGKCPSVRTTLLVLLFKKMFCCFCF